MIVSTAEVRPQEKGFTLIELMIVLTIIGILAAAALPSFSHFRSQAYVSSALQTGHGIQTALAGYAQKYGGYPVHVENWEGLVRIMRSNGVDVSYRLLRPRIAVIGWYHCYYNEYGDINCVHWSQDPNFMGASTSPAFSGEYRLFLRLDQVTPGTEGNVVMVSSTEGVTALTAAEGQQLMPT